MVAVVFAWERGSPIISRSYEIHTARRDRCARDRFAREQNADRPFSYCSFRNTNRRRFPYAGSSHRSRTHTSTRASPTIKAYSRAVQSYTYAVHTSCVNFLADLIRMIYILTGFLTGPSKSWSFSLPSPGTYVVPTCLFFNYYWRER